MSGRAIRIFLVDGTPTGLRTAEVGLSTCKAVVAPRVALDALKRRPEARRTGVYVLVGEDEQHPGRLAVYIGEGDEVFNRIASHDASKDFWTRVVIFVSKDENLTKSHVRYLEARLVRLAKEARRATVTNGNEPEGGHLPEADQAEMEEFLEHVRMLSSTLGISVFEPATTPESSDVASDASLRFAMAGEGYEAKCVVSGGELVVRKGSTARKKEAPSLSATSQALRQELLDSGTLVANGDRYGFSQDYAFESPSSAAQVVCGANVNGRITWKMPDGTTMKMWQERQLA